MLRITLHSTGRSWEEIKVVVFFFILIFFACGLLDLVYKNSAGPDRGTTHSGPCLNKSEVQLIVLTTSAATVYRTVCPLRCFLSAFFFFFHLVHNSSVCLTSPLSNHSSTKRVPKRTLQMSLHTLFSTLICQWGNRVAWGKFPFPGWLNSLCDIQIARYPVCHYSQRIIFSGDNVRRVPMRGL